MTSKNIYIMFFTAFLILSLLACSQEPATSPTIGVKPAITEKPAIKEGWEAEWGRVKEGAKKERRLVIYGSIRPLFRDAVTKAFKEKFGIDIEVIAGGTEIVARLDTERRAGLYLADIFIGGTTTPILFMKPKGMLDNMEPHLILPEVLDPKAWYGGSLMWVDKDHTNLVFIAYPNIGVGINTTFVKKGEIEYFRDYLNPRWKGKLGMFDPTTSGPGAKIFGMSLNQGVVTLDFWREMVKQEPRISRDLRLLTEWLAGGKTHVQIGIDHEILQQFINTGSTIDKIALKQGLYLTSSIGSISLLKNPAHPIAAKLFINWLLSREGQTMASKAILQQSARMDVPTDHISPVGVRQPGFDYFIGDTEELLLKQGQQMKLAAEIFAPLIR